MTRTKKDRKVRQRRRKLALAVMEAAFDGVRPWWMPKAPKITEKARRQR